MALKFAQVGNCCGASCIYDFGHTSVTLGTAAKIKIDILKMQVKGIIKIRSNIAFIIIILNKDQNEVIGKMLLEEGFHMKSEGYNSNHSTTLFLYVRSVEKEEARRRQAGQLRGNE